MSFLSLLLRTDFSLNCSPHFPVHPPNFFVLKVKCCVTLISALKVVVSVLGSRVGLRFGLIFPRINFIAALGEWTWCWL